MGSDTLKKRERIVNKVPLGDYTLVHTDKFHTNPKFYSEVEKKKDAKYIMEVSLRAKDGGWANMPCALFYANKEDPNYESRYFALFTDDVNTLMITSGQPSVTNKDGTPVSYVGVLNEDTDEVLYSAFRHDYQTHGDLMMDGGRDYERNSLHPLVYFHINKGKLVVDKVVKPNYINDSKENERTKK